MQILQAPYQSPVNVTTSLGLAFSPEDSDLLAFGEATAPGPEIVYLRAPLGLLNIDTGVPVSRNHLTALNVSPPILHARCCLHTNWEIGGWLCLLLAPMPLGKNCWAQAAVCTRCWCQRLVQIMLA